MMPARNDAPPGDRSRSLPASGTANSDSLADHVIDTETGIPRAAMCGHRESRNGGGNLRRQPPFIGTAQGVRGSWSSEARRFGGAEGSEGQRRSPRAITEHRLARSDSIGSNEKRITRGRLTIQRHRQGDLRELREELADGTVVEIVRVPGQPGAGFRARAVGRRLTVV